MMRNLTISLFLLLSLCICMRAGLAQSGDPIQPPPPPHGAAPNDDDSNLPSIVLDGTLIMSNFEGLAQSKVAFVRNLASSLLQGDNLSIMCQAGGEASMDTLPYTETTVGEVSYHKVEFANLTESSFDGLSDFLLTDGSRYFRVVLETVNK